MEPHNEIAVLTNDKDQIALCGPLNWWNINIKQIKWVAMTDGVYLYDEQNKILGIAPIEVFYKIKRRFLNTKKVSIMIVTDQLKDCGEVGFSMKPLIT